MVGSPGEKKILFIFHNSGITGASMVLLRYIRGLADEKKYAFQILLPSKGKIEAELSSLGEIFIYGPSAEASPSFFERGLKKIGLKQKVVKQNADRLMEIVLKIKPDLVYCNTIACADFVKKIKAETTIPVAWHIHELALGVKLTGIDASGMIPLADRLIANSETTAEFLLRNYRADKNKISVHCPVLPKKKTVRRQIDPGKFIIGSSGTALIHKGGLLFIRLADIMNKKFRKNNFHFTWIGNYKFLEREIEREIGISGLGDKITFTGELKNPEETYSSFDLFVSLSHEESFGLACMEAASLGIPVAGFEGSGEIERLVKGCNGLLAPHLDIEKMADSIIELSRDKKRWQEMSEQSEAFSRNFVPEKIIPGWIRTIDELISTSTKPAS